MFEYFDREMAPWLAALVIMTLIVLAQFFLFVNPPLANWMLGD